MFLCLNSKWEASEANSLRVPILMKHICLSFFSLFSLHTQTQTHTNINRIAAINHIQWVIYIYMHCLWFKSSSYDVNVDVDVVESCSSRFFPSAQFNADVSLHIHALSAVYARVCVRWVRVFVFYFLIAYLFLLLACLIRFFFHFVLVITTTTTTTTSKKEEERKLDSASIGGSCRLLWVDFFLSLLLSVDRDIHT